MTVRATYSEARASHDVRLFLMRDATVDSFLHKLFRVGGPNRLRWTPKFGPVVKLCDYGGYGLGVTTQTRPNLMKAKRKRHDAQFKARVALEALKGVQTVQQIAKEFEVHPVQVSDWKKKLNTHAGSVFESGKQQEQEDFSAERTDLLTKIGELTVKLDFVVKKSKQLGVWSGLPNSSNLNTRS